MVWVCKYSVGINVTSDQSPVLKVTVQSGHKTMFIPYLLTTSYEFHKLNDLLSGGRISVYGELG
jgi:hypothetical protein